LTSPYGYETLLSRWGTLIGDSHNGKALVISLWETEEDLRQLEANNASMREHIKAEARLESPLAEIFEVALQAS
jgi:heme-degrading monooxygenase HmoA